MTVTTTYAPATYVGDNSTTEFTLSHLTYEASHVVVTVDGAVQASGYSVSGLSSPSGITVTFDTAPALNAAITIERIVPYTQDTDLENFDGNPADVTETQFDLLAMADQQIAEEIGRTITTPIGTSITSNEISGTIDATARLITISSSGPATAEVASISGTLDTTITGLADNDILQYDATGGTWVNRAAAVNNLNASVAPTTGDDSDDGYAVGSKWYDTTADEAYVCLDASVGAAVWINTTLESSDLGSAAVADLLDEDDMASDSATSVPSQQSVKAYVDGQVTRNEAYSEVASGTTTSAIPYDDTIPQITEGAEAVSIAFTPNSASSKIQIWYGANFENSGNVQAGVTIFESGSTDAIACALYPDASNQPQHVSGFIEIDSWGTSARNISMRYGGASGTTRIGSSTGSYGTAAKGYIKIIEVE